MDQLKQFLRAAATHRFWIAVGISALLPVIAYFVGTSALADQEKAQVAKIKGTYSAVKPFESGAVKNQEWTKAVTERTEALSKDVIASWKRLYSRQAPILTWPKNVESKFMEWGRDYPKDVDPQAVRDVILDYTQAYPEAVTEVYNSFHPFDTEEGTGIVAAPPKEILLQPKVFHEEKLPTLGEVWTAQEKLWIQATLLDVVAQVNKKAKAKDWDSAWIKQILSLESASALALDQKTAATDSEALVSPPEILAPGQAEGEGSSSSAASKSPMELAYAASGSSGGGGAAAAQIVQYVKSPNPDQYFIVPVAMKVYIEQDHIPDLLVAFKNSPMSIRVLDFEMKRPLTAVQKPRKGLNQVMFAGMMSGGSSSGGRGMFRDMYRGGGPDMMASDAMMNMEQYMRGGRGGSGAAPAGPKGRQGGVDVTKKSLDALTKKNKKDDEKDKAKTEEEGPKFSNPYFNVVEVTIKGQARFYKAPPKVETPETTSPGATPDAATAETPKAEADAPAAGKATEPKAEAAAGKPDEGKPAETPAAKSDTPEAAPEKKEAGTPEAAPEKKEAGAPADPAGTPKS